jgi:hypothetical protein
LSSIKARRSAIWSVSGGDAWAGRKDCRRGGYNWDVWWEALKTEPPADDPSTIT